MSKYTAEQVEETRRISPGVRGEMLGELAALLRERESAKAGVTDEMVHVVASAMAKLDGADPDHLIWEGSPPEPWGEVWCRYEDSARTVLEAVAPMLASARVADGLSEILKELKRYASYIRNRFAISTQARVSCDDMIALVERGLQLLATAPKPETEE